MGILQQIFFTAVLHLKCGKLYEIIANKPVFCKCLYNKYWKDNIQCKFLGIQNIRK